MSEQNQATAKFLLGEKVESRSVEIKNWIDPQTPEGIAKLVKAIIALRNNADGGALIIGVDDRSNTLLPPPQDIDARFTFTEDVVQTLIAKYLTPAFEVAIEYVEEQGNTYPVLFVPGGNTTPVMCKRDLPGPNGNLLNQKTIYVRTVRHGNVSSSVADGEDLRELVEACISNREIDRARFFSKVLQGLGPADLREVLSGLQDAVTQASNALGSNEGIREESLPRFHQAAVNSGLDPDLFGFFDVALLINGPRTTEWSTNTAFLDALSSANPRLTGWPVWLVANTFQDERVRPRVRGNVFEQYILDEPTQQQNSWGGSHWDFSVFDPRGCFFLRRVLQDDFRSGEFYERRKLSLDPVLQIRDVAETLRVGQRFAEVMQYDPAKTFLYFQFWWSYLEGRIFGSWVAPGADFFAASRATDDLRYSKVRLPMNAARAELNGYISDALKPLTHAFGGYELPDRAVEFWTDRLFDRNA